MMRNKALMSSHSCSDNRIDPHRTFFLTNICPQVGEGFNRDYWAYFVSLSARRIDFIRLPSDDVALSQYTGGIHTRPDKAILGPLRIYYPALPAATRPSQAGQVEGQLRGDRQPAECRGADALCQGDPRRGRTQAARATSTGQGLCCAPRAALGFGGDRLRRPALQLVTRRSRRIRHSECRGAGRSAAAHLLRARRLGRACGGSDALPARDQERCQGAVRLRAVRNRQARMARPSQGLAKPIPSGAAISSARRAHHSGVAVMERGRGRRESTSECISTA